MIKREIYLEKIREYIDNPLIKVLTGIRQSGKSVLINQLKNELQRNHESEVSIIYLNFESLECKEIDTADKLFLYVKDRVRKGRMNYILLDEVQEVNSCISSLSGPGLKTRTL